MPLQVLMTIFSLYRKQEQNICSKMLSCLMFFNHSASLTQEVELQIDVMNRNLKYTIQDHHFETSLFVFCFLL